jgi:predicted secreted protein
VPQCHRWGLLIAALALLVQTAPAHAALVEPQPRACREADVPPDVPVVVTAGEPFAVVVATQPGTGFSWRITSGPDPAIATFDGDTLLPLGAVLPGSAQLSCFAFAATGPGETSISLACARPFEPDAAPAQTLEISAP